MTVKYPCGCSASGPGVPKWCPEHGAQEGVVCEHGTAMDVHCCNCHSGFLFDVNSCVCALTETQADPVQWREMTPEEEAEADEAEMRRRHSHDDSDGGLS
jgi:hypothetical protein